MSLIWINRDLAELAARWIAAKENADWLDFNNGAPPSPLAIRVMSQLDAHCIRLFTPDGEDAPIGLVALSDIHPRFRSARLWYVLGDKRYAGGGHTKRSVAELLRMGFQDLGLESVNAWVVESNAPSIAILRANGFRRIGAQRRCHFLDGTPHDRLLFDLLATEFGSRNDE